jgi:hypothetical protein
MTPVAQVVAVAATWILKSRYPLEAPVTNHTFFVSMIFFVFV